MRPGKTKLGQVILNDKMTLGLVGQKLISLDTVILCPLVVLIVELIRLINSILQKNADDPEYFSVSDLYADEPLYQVYHRDAVVRDVLEQTMEGWLYALLGLPAAFRLQLSRR